MAVTRPHRQKPMRTADGYIQRDNKTLGTLSFRFFQND